MRADLPLQGVQERPQFVPVDNGLAAVAWDPGFPVRAAVGDPDLGVVSLEGKPAEYLVDVVRFGPGYGPHGAPPAVCCSITCCCASMSCSDAASSAFSLDLSPAPSSSAVSRCRRVAYQPLSAPRPSRPRQMCQLGKAAASPASVRAGGVRVCMGPVHCGGRDSPTAFGDTSRDVSRVETSPEGLETSRNVSIEWACEREAAHRDDADRRRRR